MAYFVHSDCHMLHTAQRSGQHTVTLDYHLVNMNIFTIQTDSIFNSPAYVTLYAPHRAGMSPVEQHALAVCKQSAECGHSDYEALQDA